MSNFTQDPSIQNVEGLYFSTQESQNADDPNQQESPAAAEEAGGRGSDIFGIHFKKVPRPNSPDFDAICNYCKVSYKFKAGGGYGTLRRHIQKVHPSKESDATAAAGKNIQTQISGYASSSTTQLFRYSDEKNKLELAKMISIMHLSFSFGEKFGFNEYCKTALNPCAKRIPRNTLKRAVLKMYNDSKKELIREFLNLDSSVSICSDIWSDHWRSQSYMGVTCHWIDNEWFLQKRIIAYRFFHERHTAGNIAKMIINILVEYGLVKKIFSISFDNAAANTASINELQNICQPNIGGKFFHIRCACHVLNLCVQDGLKSLDVILEPIRKTHLYLWAHSQTMKSWGKFCRDNGKRPRKFSKDVPTRWNSTYQLLSESYEYRELLCNFMSINVPHMTIYPQNWDSCANLLELLKTFNNATCLLSGVYYPTSHLLLIECINIADVFQEYQDDTVLKETINIMKTKWLHYYREIPLINLIACIFDPRTKLEGLTDYLNYYYQLLGIEVDVDMIIYEVKKSLNELFFEFSSNYGSSSTSTPPPPCEVEDSSRIRAGDRMVLARFKKPRASSALGSSRELDIYLTTVFSFPDNSTGKDFPILEWWCRHQNTYPIMARIAKSIFASPVSTVAVEQAFSAGGNILDETRSSMNPQSLEAQTCIDDWCRAAARKQEFERSPEGEEELFEFTTDGTGSTTTGAGSD